MARRGTQGNPCACCWRWIPRSATFLQLTASFLVYGLICAMVFSRSMYAVIQGVLGILMSLEAYFTVSRGERWFLKWYSAYMALNVAASVIIGAFTLSNLEWDCSFIGVKTDASDSDGSGQLGLLAASTGQTAGVNKDTCLATGLTYALMITLGGTSIGFVAAVSAAVVYFSMKDEGKSDTDKKLEL